MIPPFSHEMYQIWLKQMPIQDIPPDAMMTPGGFHSFEHRWSLGEAFRFHMAIGKAQIAARIHTLNRQLKEGLAENTSSSALPWPTNSLPGSSVLMSTV
jgi:selenocysteine lyase/cysteine desulfurase